MGVDWSDLRQHSSILAAQAQSEGDLDAAELFYRTAVSRAYYSVYHHAFELRVSYFGFSEYVSGTSSHRRLWEDFKGSGQGHIKNKGLALHKIRNDADYHFDKGPWNDGSVSVWWPKGN